MVSSYFLNYYVLYCTCINYFYRNRVSTKMHFSLGNAIPFFKTVCMVIMFFFNNFKGFYF